VLVIARRWHLLHGTDDRWKVSFVGADRGHKESPAVKEPAKTGEPANEKNNVVRHWSASTTE
jgi:hypothetical protein